MAVNRCTNEKCEYFNRTLPNNANNCPGCGLPLGVVAPKPQPNPKPGPPSGDNSTEYQPPPPVRPTPPTVRVDYNPQPSKLPLLRLIHSSGREFQWSGEAGFIGRRRQGVNIPPDIDLTGIEHDGIVSRPHARISWDWSQNCYMIVDISTNGIYLNGTPLSKEIPYRLISGDSLQFGQDNLVRFAVVIV